MVNALERDTRSDAGKAVMVAAGALLCLAALSSLVSPRAGR
jgi:hypothetical protein